MSTSNKWLPPKRMRHRAFTLKHKAHTKAATVEWPGFSMTQEGGSEVIVTFSQKVAVPIERHSDHRLMYIFKDVHLVKANNHNPLLTYFWNTPVVRAQLLSTHKEIQLVIELRTKQAIIPTSGFRAAQSGVDNQFFVRFPSGNYLPALFQHEQESTMPHSLESSTPDFKTPTSFPASN